MAAGDGLFEKVMKGRWKEILGVDAFNLSEKITQSEDTALHIAVMNGKTDVVIRLVENMKGMASSILKTKNVKGNTCLHLAASIGDVDMCHCIASRDWTLITEVNNDGETPLFLASLNGKKGAFFTLRSLAEGKLDDKYKLCRRFDGNTILHSAIYGEHYGEEKEESIKTMRETAILTAAKSGVTEIVEKILDTFPVAIHDLDSDSKNAVLLAVEHRQIQVFKMLTKKTILKESVFSQLDKDGNSALHLAATFGDYRPWLIPGAGLQMQWEIKWYHFVEHSMPENFFAQYNRQGLNPRQIFTETHKDLAKTGSEWLTKTSESCSVVAALIATVAFATASAVPGGNKDENGAPILQDQPVFNVFAISSLVALCFSVTSLLVLLTIITSRFEQRDFDKKLPRTLLLGLTSLFLSIVSILVSFCAGHVFVLKDNLRFISLPIYAATCFPVALFLVAQLSLYFDLMKAIFSDQPQRSFKEIRH
ncbi:Ankyrin repeat-containing protein At5g02620 [Linum perenne]